MARDRDLMEGSCGHINEPSGSIKAENLTIQAYSAYYQLLKDSGALS